MPLSTGQQGAPAALHCALAAQRKGTLVFCGNSSAAVQEETVNVLLTCQHGVHVPFRVVLLHYQPPSTCSKRTPSPLPPSLIPGPPWPQQRQHLSQLGIITDKQQQICSSYRNDENFFLFLNTKAGKYGIFVSIAAVKV